MRQISNLKELEDLFFVGKEKKVRKDFEDAAKKLALITEEGFEFSDVVENEFYLGKPTGFANFQIVNFSKSSEDGTEEKRQILLYQKGNKLVFYKGSLGELRRHNEQMQRKNNIWLYQKFAQKAIDVLAQNTSFIDGIDIRKNLNLSLFKEVKDEKGKIIKTNNNKNKTELDIDNISNVVNALNKIFEKCDPNIEFQISETEKDNINLCNFIASEITCSVDSEGKITLPIEHIDQLQYVIRMLKHSVELEIDERIGVNKEGNVKTFEGLSSVVGVFGGQARLAEIIAQRGTPKDFENIIYCDTDKVVKDKEGNTLKRRKMSENVVRELFQAAKSVSVRNFLSHSSIAPIFTRLYREGGMSHNLKQPIQHHLAEYVLSVPQNDAHFIEKMFSCRSINSTDKCIGIIHYLRAALEGDQVKKDRVVRDEFSPRKDFEYNLEKISKYLTAFGENYKDNALLIDLINDQLTILVKKSDTQQDIQKSNWVIKDGKIVIDCLNYFGNPVTFEIKASEIVSALENVNKQNEEIAKNVLAIVKQQGIGNERISSNVIMYIANEDSVKVPHIKYMSYDLNTPSHEGKMVDIELTNEDKKEILEHSDNSVKMSDELINLIKSTKSLTDDERSAIKVSITKDLQIDLNNKKEEKKVKPPVLEKGDDIDMDER